MGPKSETKPDVDYVLVDFEPLHKQRWRTDNARLVCAEFPPFTTCLWHQHLKYGIYVVMALLDVVEQPYGEEPRPLVQKKGAVFCRDHTKDELIHLATTKELPAFLIEVEILKEKVDVVPNKNMPLHEGKGIELLKNEPECRVYRFSLQGNDDQATAEIVVNLSTEAVLLALEDCEVGGDVHLKAGNFGVKLLSSGARTTSFILAEVF
ncbi:uncharacterized protein PITG_07348 [Phytophthora infestans T30-4]|uniref:Uncharacterized protein n=1 Tax=Phytophthora infestans (strain T30-4) TaxID=403677 RepID=D0N7V9_PHYIT|nr:uncharacterized protein PITG_07348 [Phytophthora infestans T30-4]EEY53658.1 conserved hypothetical protein [Phytophthora infestans T30-4]|eukprot:XP_002905276.1 conserved hypothetical protein [Phytophthora infestans T30-4]